MIRRKWYRRGIRTQDLWFGGENYYVTSRDGTLSKLFSSPRVDSGLDRGKRQRPEGWMGEASRNACRHVIMLYGSREEFLSFFLWSFWVTRAPLCTSSPFVSLVCPLWLSTRWTKGHEGCHTGYRRHCYCYSYRRSVGNGGSCVHDITEVHQEENFEH